MDRLEKQKRALGHNKNGVGVRQKGSADPVAAERDGAGNSVEAVKFRGVKKWCQIVRVAGSLEKERNETNEPKKTSGKQYAPIAVRV